MKVVFEQPPNISQIRKYLTPHKDVVFTYGDTIYAPNGVPIPDHLLAHEEVHAFQQANPDEWWEKYLTDVNFRLEQETEAYQMQYRAFCKHHKDKNARFRFLHSVTTDLSSKIYGSIISYNAAIIAIKS